MELNGEWDEELDQLGTCVNHYFIVLISPVKYNLSDFLFNKQGDNHTDESSSSNSELRTDKHRNKLVSFHQSDSDDMSISIAVVKALNSKVALRMKHPLNSLFRGE